MENFVPTSEFSVCYPIIINIMFTLFYTEQKQSHTSQRKILFMNKLSSYVTSYWAYFNMQLTDPYC